MGPKGKCCWKMTTALDASPEYLSGLEEGGSVCNKGVEVFDLDDGKDELRLCDALTWFEKFKEVDELDTEVDVFKGVLASAEELIELAVWFMNITSDKEERNVVNPSSVSTCAYLLRC